MMDIKLDTTTHDLYINPVTLDLELVTGLDAIVQALKMRLAFIWQEWYLDSTQGIRFFDYMQQKNPDIGLIDSVIKTVILETAGVKELLSYTSEYSVSARSLTVRFDVNTIYGTTSITQGI